ncbi:MAG: hypothetical protein AAGF36_16430 [Pseudomonadota bacterium]
MSLCIATAVAACTSPISTADGPTGPELPPLGLASTAIWLEQREALLPRHQRRAAEVRAEQSVAAPQPTAQPLAAPTRPVTTAAAAAPQTSTRVNVDRFVNRILFADSNAEIATLVFVEACLKTSASPNDAAGILKQLGFKERRERRGSRFTTDYATVLLSNNPATGAFGQCVVQPRNATFEQVVPEFTQQIEASGVPVRKLSNEIAYVIGDTRAVALVSRAGGAMTRTQRGVFRSQ